MKQRANRRVAIWQGHLVKLLTRGRRRANLRRFGRPRLPGAAADLGSQVRYLYDERGSVCCFQLSALRNNGEKGGGRVLSFILSFVCPSIMTPYTHRDHDEPCCHGPVLSYVCTREGCLTSRDGAAISLYQYWYNVKRGTQSRYGCSHGGPSVVLSAF